MIISASRRTDIPAFYSQWFMNRIHAGFCTVPNPFNRNQVAHISLQVADVDVIVFWTRNPRPLLPHLGELDARGYRYYFQYTLMDNPRALENKTPSLPVALATFQELAKRIGASRVIWRYDPIVLTEKMDGAFHAAKFAAIARALRGSTQRVVISIVDSYANADRRLAKLQDQGLAPGDAAQTDHPQVAELMQTLAYSATVNDMEIGSCAERIDLSPYSIRPGKCIDDELIRRVFGIDVPAAKDPHQRAACGCVAGKDIGMYTTCLFGCQYCYATSSFAQAQRNHDAHDPASPSLIGWYEAVGRARDMMAYASH